MHYVAYDFLTMMKDRGTVVDDISDIASKMLKHSSHFVYIPPGTHGHESARGVHVLVCV